MESILVSPKNQQELDLLNALFAKMNIASKVLDDETKEELGISILMKEADRSKTVSRETIMGKLKS